jgi:hypothetical protein
MRSHRRVVQDRRVRRREAAEAEADAAHPYAPAPDRIAQVLALQGSAGNAAVARILAGPTLMRAGWSKSEKGGWNEEEKAVQGTLRVPIEGLSVGNKFAAADTKQTSEIAGDKDSGRAVVIVPDGTDFSGGKLEVLLHFHGYGVGFRQRSADHKSGAGAAGEVRDVAVDEFPKQLVSSGRNAIAILPQGTLTSGFATGPTQAYVTEVLDKLRGELAKLKPTLQLPPTLTAYRVISSGHSGGGPTAVQAAKELQGGDWHRAAPLLLFDAINGTGELATVKSLLGTWLKADLAHLKAAADPNAELDKRGLRFRSTYSSGGGVYPGTNVGGTPFMQGIWEKGKRIGEQEVTVAPADSVRGFLNAWFRKQEKGPLAAHVPKWEAQYRVEAVASQHEQAVGTTSAAKGKGGKEVPGYKAGSGNLEKSLQLLPGDATRPAGGGAAPPKTGLLDLEREDEDELAYA